MTTPAKKPAAPRSRAAAAKPATAAKAAPKTAAVRKPAAKPVAKPVARKVAAKPAVKSAAAKAAPATEAPKPYKMLTGPDDSEFCSKVSRHLAEGYELYGSPTMTFNGKTVIVGQAVVLKAGAKKAAKGKGSKGKKK